MLKAYIEGLGSKRLASVVTWLILTVLTHVLATVATKTGLPAPTPDQINTLAAYGGGLVAWYVMHQTRTDIATDGATSTAARLTTAAGAEAPKP